jgi:hypothetical protein
MKPKPFSNLPWTSRCDGSTWDHPPHPSGKTKSSTGDNGKPFQNNGKRHKGMETIHTLHIPPITEDTIKTILIHNNHELTIDILLDTGALQGNYISIETANWLRSKGAKASNVNSNKVCSAYGECKHSLGTFTTYLKFCNEITNLYETHLLVFKTVDIDFDMVIGRPTIKSLKLTKQFPSQFEERDMSDVILENTEGKGQHDQRPNNKRPHKETQERTAVTSAGLDAELTLCPCSAGLDQSDCQCPEKANLEVNSSLVQPQIPSLNRDHMSRYIRFEAGATGINPRALEEPRYQTINLLTTNKRVAHRPNSTAEYQHEEQSKTNFIPPNIQGDDETFVENIKSVCTEFLPIFNTCLNPQPANVPPMELKVDPIKWRDNSNKGAPRQQTPGKQKEIQKQVEILLQNDVIIPSLAENYSHVHLTPKPMDGWRFCLDFKKLNDASEGMSWPIPNIQQMLRRLGDQRPKYFGKIDLTSGYHQAPLSKASRVWTAFITFMGVYEWLRVPMGLKGAASYFQSTMASTVLVGLLYYICEVYLDDIVIYAQTQEEFLIRLRQVLQRLQKHKLTVNPNKCILGITEVEFVGHTINHQGLSFSREKLDKVFEIPEPVFGKELKSFLGVAVYFMDHIRNHASIVKPLHAMIRDYDRNRKLVWTEDGKAAFLQIKEAINNCPILFFLDDTSPIYLHTDASDYGIGAYLFQVVDEKDTPIAFMSHSLTDTELGWSTIEKECYAIVYALEKFEYVIRDRTFTIRTDHKNLTYIDADTNPKVKRWKLFIQEYDFYIEHISGEANFVADAFSRLLPMTEERLCLINEFRLSKREYSLIQAVHNSVSGHHGVERTYQKLIQQGHAWMYMREHIKRFIKLCPCCQKMSYLSVPIHTSPFTTASYNCMERLNVDSIGPLSPDDEGNTYILVIICCFSRWVELFAIKDLTALIAAKALLEHVGRFGTPAQIVTDNGTQFANKIIEELLKLMGTENVKILAYSKEENAIVERANKEVMRHLRAIIFDKNIITDWRHDLPLVHRIMNASKVVSTGASPAEIILGPSINLDRGIFLPLQPETGTESAESLSTW